MEIIKERKDNSYCIRISAKKDGKEVGSVHLYIITNDFHKEPYGLIEYLIVDENHRQQGIGSELITSVIEEATKQGCYKLLGQSRHSRPKVHALYEKFGFTNHGLNFRMDLSGPIGRDSHTN
ncbi:GNAT family N-acetyltransferase [Candidatus Woesearchaeota archaeon]|jgi:GNAT superfamily N-acetyltransferase|nr:GNAT family N-acetyltransferase [Candidatus Woesearchaeota archaeon]MBT5397529.1 GNAT family N-acetyltransferase [Candidatus Woesearchaeota archaeon]MBT5924105.1 GNAT family N-acetyltransferase [Candidatus Woesearchaeota archaeon]MBT6367898.1 GNAT family N-acetyltransferase [Candidatus Woesearchaeota archaeon]MBT7763122.1 GNAT family N-acetyltransferase [Candidatus Woesearchaeota archaeon]